MPLSLDDNAEHLIGKYTYYNHLSSGLSMMKHKQFMKEEVFFYNKEDNLESESFLCSQIYQYERLIGK